MFAKWNTAYASAIGTSHEKTGSPCQDACRCRVVYTNDGQDIFLGIASDGAGSASRSEVASTLAVGMFLEKFSGLIKTENDILLIDKNVVLNWLEEVKTQIFIRARNETLNPREFACTILGAVVGPNHSIFFRSEMALLSSLNLLLMIMDGFFGRSMENLLIRLISSFKTISQKFLILIVSKAA